MPKRHHSPNAKGRILEVAKEIFAEKGFDGSRVDEIAKKANVPKSLIYYHFKSKDAILEELLKTCLAEYEAILDEVSTTQPASSSEALAGRIRTVYLKFLEEHEDTIRIISMEALKKGSEKAHLAFKFVESFMEIDDHHRKRSGQTLTAEARSEKMVVEFFTSFIPVTLFSCFRDVWSEYFDVDQEALSEQFLTAYNSTYGEYRRQK
ncbi:hypothetical protein CSA56_08590 [candidate division KSB3 bacterium]|uniref:HTH tetR-type domain-containing protein n=1 Tax=candidate division KSB3 bacterium TaxID=2044937 RepID=A0A2G6KET3_9BACT|nr:MAG: hypothetical protein CSA56_08590 [candidate division KSB3 bacterium]